MHTAKVVVHEVDCPDLVGDAKTTHWQSRVWRFAPSVLGLAVSCSLGAQSRPEGPALPEALAERLIVASNSIDPVEAGSQLDRLVSRLHNSSSLLRVQTIEAIDASPAVTAETANSILQDALQDQDPLVAQTALRALLHRGDEQLFLVRESDLTRFSGETSELAHVHVAAHNQDTSALRELMRNGDAIVQDSAFEALASNDTDAAVEQLKNEFLDPASLYRLQTLELFARSPYTNSSATLIPILESASNEADPLLQSRAKQLLTEKTAETTPEE